MWIVGHIVEAATKASCSSSVIDLVEFFIGDIRSCDGFA